jgi:hypothetical protein
MRRYRLGYLCDYDCKLRRIERIRGVVFLRIEYEWVRHTLISYQCDDKQFHQLESTAEVEERR